MIARGEGIYLYDDSGKRYIDGSGGPLVVNVGHGRTEIVDAMMKQAQSVAYVHAIMFTSEPLERYAAELAKVVPLPEARFYFLSSGSEVVEGAVKLARQIQIARGEVKRNIVLGRWNSYHGMTLGALAVSGRPSLRAPYLDMFHDVPHIPTPYPYRSSTTGIEVANRLEEAILSYGAENIAGFIAEPISGASLERPPRRMITGHASGKFAIATAFCSSLTKSSSGWDAPANGGDWSIGTLRPTSWSPRREQPAVIFRSASSPPKARTWSNSGANWAISTTAAPSAITLWVRLPAWPRCKYCNANA